MGFINIVDKLYKGTSLQARLEAANKIAFIDLLHELGYASSIEKAEIEKIEAAVNSHAKWLIKIIDEWKIDSDTTKMSEE